MAGQKPWDRTEAAILLEALIQVRAGELSRKEAIASVSKTLRKKAEMEGIEIDEVFRNIAGITFQMHSMESAYVGKTLMKPATKLFSEIVLLRKEKPVEYYKLLEGRYPMNNQQEIINNNQPQTSEMEAMSADERKNRFINWMMEHDMAERTATSYASSCGLAAQIALDNGTIEKEIWEITDTEIVKEMIFSLLEDQEFIEKNESRHNQFRASLVKYVQFLGDEDFTLGRNSTRAAKALTRNVNDDAVYNAYPEMYLMLHSMSKVYDDPNGMSIMQIKNMLDSDMDDEVLISILKELTWVTEVGENTFSFSPKAKAYEKPIDFNKDAFIKVLMSRYRGGMRFDSIDLENFRDTYFGFEDEKIDLSDDDLEKCLRKCGIMWQGRLFPAEAIIPNDVKEKLLTYIDSNFIAGKQILYYKAIFNDLSDDFKYCYFLTEPQMLKPYLEFVCEQNKYYFAEEYISVEKNIKIDHTAEIEEFLLSAGKPLSYEEIFVGLPHISKDIISSEIRTNKNIVMNLREHYFHYGLFEFSSEDADQITDYINDEIEEEGYCIWSKVYDRIKTEMPLFIENNPYLSSVGIRNSVAKKLSGRFNFDGEVIGQRGKSLNMAAVFSSYGLHHAPFSDEDIYLFSKEVNGGVTYFDALAENTVRVSRELFIPKSQIQFDIEETDKALSTYLTTGYMLIKDVDSFLMFPNVGYEWNAFLLESYLLHFSKDYALCNNGQSLNNVAGALVKRGSSFDEFENICADALAHGYVELNKTAALNYLADENLLTRRSYAGIEGAIQKAKQIRNKKGQ